MVSLREKAARLLFPRIGSNMPPPVRVSDDVDRVLALLDVCPVGGLILFNGSAGETRKTLERLRVHSGRTLLIASDIERGAGQQIAGATVFPHAMAYSALGDEAESLARASARATAEEARSEGIHITFAPVADVNRDPRNPIISTRAFGVDPEAVSRLIRAYIEGLHEGGLLATAKHFPGHGNTRSDSHAELPIVTASFEELDAFDLAPFRAAIAEGVNLMMSAHVVYPALDPENRPATLSPPILTHLLRERMGFRGAVVTDSLLMGAVRDRFSDPGRFAVELVAAGADILLDPADPVAMVDGLVQAVECGELPESRLDEAFRRVDALVASGHRRHPAPRPAAGRSAHEALAQEVADKAVAVWGNVGSEPSALALTGESLLFIYVVPYRTDLDPEESPLAEAVRIRFPKAGFVEVGPESSPADLDRLAREAARFQTVVAAAVAKPAAWRPFGLLPAHRDFLAGLTSARPTILASLGTPQVLDELPQTELKMCTFSDVPASQRALVNRLARMAGLP